MAAGARISRRAGMALALAGAILLALSGTVRSDPGKDQAEIRKIVTDEIVPGILRKSPDLFLRSYLPTATVYSFAKGAVDTVQYRRILDDFFRSADPKELDYDIVSLRITDNTASMTVAYVERGKRTNGSDYRDGYKRYYRLVKAFGTWKIRVDGYNEKLVEVESFHGRPKQRH